MRSDSPPTHPRKPRPARPRGAGPGRRAVLAAGAGALATYLAVRGVRLEPGAPAVPLVPVRSVEQRAIWIWRELRWVRQAAAALAAKGARPPAATVGLAKIHARQEEVLLSRLHELGEDPSDTTRLNDAAGPAPEAAPLPAAEAGGLSAADLGDVGSWPLEEAAMVLSLRVQRGAAYRRLGGKAAAAPVAAVASPQEAARLVAALRAAEYGAEVATARSTAGMRRRLAGALRWVSATRLTLETLAGTSDPGAPLGYSLPRPVTDDATAVALVRGLLTGVVDAMVAGAEPAAGNTPAMRTLLHWGVEAELLALALGGPMRAFPGLTAR